MSSRATIEFFRKITGGPNSNNTLIAYTTVPEAIGEGGASRIGSACIRARASSPSPTWPSRCARITRTTAGTAPTRAAWNTKKRITSRAADEQACQALSGQDQLRGARAWITGGAAASEGRPPADGVRLGETSSAVLSALDATSTPQGPRAAAGPPAADLQPRFRRDDGRGRRLHGRESPAGPALNSLSSGPISLYHMAMGSNLEDKFQTLHEIVKAARENLAPGPWDYMAGGAESETTLRRNRLAIDSWPSGPASCATCPRSTPPRAPGPPAHPGDAGPVGSIETFAEAAAPPPPRPPRSSAFPRCSAPSATRGWRPWPRPPTTSASSSSTSAATTPGWMTT